MHVLPCSRNFKTFLPWRWNVCKSYTVPCAFASVWSPHGVNSWKTIVSLKTSNVFFSEFMKCASEKRRSSYEHGPEKKVRRCTTVGHTVTTWFNTTHSLRNTYVGDSPSRKQIVCMPSRSRICMSNHNIHLQGMLQIHLSLFEPNGIAKLPKTERRIVELNLNSCLHSLTRSYAGRFGNNFTVCSTGGGPFNAQLAAKTMPVTQGASVVQRKRAGLWYPSSRVRTRPKPSDF